MLNREKNGVEECERFLESLELVRLNVDEEIEREKLLANLPAEIRGHEKRCASCAEAAEDFVEMRKMLLSAVDVAKTLEPGPWFSAKVMGAIEAEENEIEEREGVWQSVMKLAPKLAAVCALVLVLSGTWAVQTRREILAKQGMRRGEGLFGTSHPSVLDDDVLANIEAH